MPTLDQLRRVAEAAALAGPYATSIAVYAKARKGAYQKIVEFAQLLALVRRRRPASIVEIGTGAGGTLWAWCRVGANDATIVSVDLPGGPFGGGYPDDMARKLRGYATRTQRVELLRLDAHNFATQQQVSETLRTGNADVVFIDGDHSYDGVRRDFELYAPLSRDLIVLHDILPHDNPACEVDRFWREVKGGFRYDEFVDIRHVDPTLGRWGGIGVLYVGT